MNYLQIKNFIEQHPDTQLFKRGINKIKDNGELSKLKADLPNIRPDWIEIAYEILTSDSTKDILNKYTIEDHVPNM